MQIIERESAENRIDHETMLIVDTAILLLMTLGPVVAGSFLLAHNINARVAAAVLSDTAVRNIDEYQCENIS